MTSEYSSIMGPCPYWVSLRQNAQGSFYWVIRTKNSVTVATSAVVKRRDNAVNQSQNIARWMGAKWFDDTPAGRKFPGRSRLRFDRAPEIKKEDGE